MHVFLYENKPYKNIIDDSKVKNIRRTEQGLIKLGITFVD